MTRMTYYAEGLPNEEIHLLKANQANSLNLKHREDGSVTFVKSNAMEYLKPKSFYYLTPKLSGNPPASVFSVPKNQQIPNLEYKLFQIPSHIGLFEVTRVKHFSQHRINVSKLKKVISQEKRRLHWVSPKEIMIAQYGLYEEDDDSVFKFPKESICTIELMYIPTVDELKISYKTGGKSVENALADRDDPHLTTKDFPTALEYLLEVILEKDLEYKETGQIE